MYHPRQVLSEFSYLVGYLVSKQNKEKSSVYYVETQSHFSYSFYQTEMTQSGEQTGATILSGLAQICSATDGWSPLLYIYVCSIQLFK